MTLDEQLELRRVFYRYRTSTLLLAVEWSVLGVLVAVIAFAVWSSFSATDPWWLVRWLLFPVCMSITLASDLVRRHHANRVLSDIAQVVGEPDSISVESIRAKESEPA